MINVGTGNLLLQADDLSVPHKGMALALRRTYNSQSGHDVNGTDGTPAGMYGNGWTSTFDAHLVAGPNNAIYVYDIDGARYDYVPAPAGGYQAPPGQHATIHFDGQCGYIWTKKSGTVYRFYRKLMSGAGCGSSQAALAGRLYQIIGRNQNTTLTLAYAWDNGYAGDGGKIGGITATTESGLSSTLAFADVAGNRLLRSLSRPDGSVVSYGYDSSGNLTSVTSPPNNAAGTAVVHGYGYVAGTTATPLLSWAASPRWTASGGSDGGYLRFGYQSGTSNAATTLDEMDHLAYVDPTPADGTGTPIQVPVPASAGAQTAFLSEYYALGVLGTAATATYRDSDGHATNWVTDGSGRTTQTQECTAAQNQQCTGQFLVTGDQWDAANNRTAEVDARGYETDYAYDANGNTVAAAAPLTSIVTSVGTSTGRPTRLYSYDGFNNIVAFCDETWSHANGRDWNVTGNPGQSDGLCPQQSGATRMAYQYPSLEPFGELQSVTSPATTSAPSGYARRFSYDPGPQGGTDFGLPTSVQGDSFTQADNSTRTPQQSFWYDAVGSLRCYSKGAGQWVLAYDVMGRLTSVADPDDSSANGTSACGKTGGRPQWNTQTTYAYFSNGQVSSSQTPAERAAGVSSASTYDVDGNQLTESHHYTCTQACTGTTTTKWYDGLDRLVEVALPQDINDFYSFGWLTRYVYDISGGQGTAIAGQPVIAHGGLFKTQEWNTAPGAAGQSWLDIKGNAFDALDRTTRKYTFQPGTNGALMSAVLAYDADAAHAGLLSSTTNPEGETAAYGYDERSNIGSVSFANARNATPNRAYGYDANGRRTTESSAVYGTKTTAYDAAGVLSEVREAAGGNVSSPATIGYDSYPDGMRKDVNVSSALLNAAQLITYAYRTDGALASTAANYAGRSFPLASTYTDGGRIMSRTDPLTGRAIPNPTAPVSAGSTYAPTTWSYDATGQLSGHGMPYAYSYTGITHDAEGHMLGWHTSLPAYGDVSMQFANSNRGENAGSTLLTTTYGQISTSSVRLGHGAPIEFNPKTPSIDNLDPFNGVVTAMSGYSEHDPYGDGVTTANCASPNTTTATYDRAGRMLAHDVVVYDSAPITCGSDDRASRSSAYSYDAEDHTVELNGDSSNCVGWGPDGKAITFTGSLCGPAVTGTATDTLHYDGDQILFVTTSVTGGGTTLGLVRVGLLGSVAPGSSPRFLADDRDISGSIVTSHSDSGYSGVNFGTKVWQVHTGPRGGEFDGGATYTNRVGVAIAASSGYTGGLGAPGTAPYTYDGSDGFTVGGKRFQGVRVMDSETGRWTTPDAYAGDVHDPMSQKPFMWNRNNPYEYSDPSGYCAIAQPLTCVPPLPSLLTSGAVLGRAAAAAVGGAVLTLFGGVVAILSLSGDTPQADYARGKNAAPNHTAPGIGAIRRGGSVTYYDKDGFRTKRVDLTGRSHNGVPTPHTTQFGKPNFDADGNQRPGNQQEPQPSSPHEVTDAEGRPQGASPP